MPPNLPTGCAAGLSRRPLFLLVQGGRRAFYSVVGVLAAGLRVGGFFSRRSELHGGVLTELASVLPSLKEQAA